MSISTKTGDEGKTSLWSGERVSKNSLRVDAYGTVDELNSHLSEAKHMVKSKKNRCIILKIQNDLFKVAGSLASTTTYAYPLLEEDVHRLTGYVHEIEEEVPMKGFVIPGSTPQSAKLDVCRTIARRAERSILTLHETEAVPAEVKQYINRLSDLIYCMARYEEHRVGALVLKQWP